MENTLENFYKTLYFILPRLLIVLLIALLIIAVIAFFYFGHQAKKIALIVADSPENNPNTKWTCLEKDLYFISDENGQTLGVGRLEDRQFFFEATFIYSHQVGAQTMALIETDALHSPKSDYNSGVMTMIEGGFRWNYKFYSESASLFGEAEGDGTLTFVKENLPAPVRFTDNGYMTGNGEAVIWIKPEENAA